MEEFTAKFKVDVSDLKKSITDASKQIKLANATFKAETAGMDDWSKDADGLSKKLKQLKSVLEGQKQILSSYQQQLQRQQEAYEENGRRADALKQRLKALADQGVSRTDEEYQRLERELKSVQKEQENNGKACDKLRIQVLDQQAAVSKTEAEMRKYGTQLESVEQEQREAAEAAKKQKTAYEQLTDTVSEQERRLKELKSKYAEVVIAEGKDSDAAKALKRDIANLSGELQTNKTKLNDADHAADEFDDTLRDVSKESDNTSGGFSGMQVALGNFVSMAVQAAIQALKDLAKAAYDAWESFDEGADKITAITGATGENAEALQGAYKNLARTVKADFADIGTAVGEVSTRFGYTGDELESVAGLFLKFAEINNTDVKTSIDNVQSAMAAWGIKAEDTTAFLDTLNRAGQESGTSVDQLSSQLVSNSEALQELGFSAADAIKFISSLSKNGIDSSTAMAGFKKALQNATKAGYPLDTTMQRVYNSIAKAGTETQALKRATDLFGAKAAPALTAAIRDGRLTLDDFGASLEDAKGSVENTYDSMLDAPDKIAVAMQNLKLQAAESLGAIFEQYGPQIEELINKFMTEYLPKIMDGVEWFIDHLPEIMEYIEYIAKSSRIKEMVLAVGFLKDAWESFKETMAGLPNFIYTKAIQPVIKVFTGLWDHITHGASRAWTGIKTAFSAVSSWFGSIFSAAWQKIQDVFSTWGTFFSGLWDKIKTTFSGLGTRLGEAIGGSVKTAINRVISWIESTINRAIGLINGAIGVINAIPGVNIGKINTVSLPRLEKGGILKKGQVGLLEGSGAEAVVPLSQNKKWVSAIASEMLRQLANNNVTNNSSIKNNTTNYTQNIYAPTAPSRIEIYRQTKNLLNLAQGGII